MVQRPGCVRRQQSAAYAAASRGFVDVNSIEEGVRWLLQCERLEGPVAAEVRVERPSKHADDFVAAPGDESIVPAVSTPVGVKETVRKVARVLKHPAQRSAVRFAESFDVDYFHAPVDHMRWRTRPSGAIPGPVTRSCSLRC